MNGKNGKTVRIEPKTTKLDDALWTFTLAKFGCMGVMLAVFFGGLFVLGLVLFLADLLKR